VSLRSFPTRRSSDLRDEHRPDGVAAAEHGAVLRGGLVVAMTDWHRGRLRPGQGQFDEAHRGHDEDEVGDVADDGPGPVAHRGNRSEEHTSELQSLTN